MAGETVRSEAICLDIRPWSRTSHVVSWLTPVGKVATVVKGAVRSKSFFLGQYDLNYTCDILYYAGAKGDVHALRDCVPVRMREGLRDDYRALALAGYFRRLVGELAPAGAECAAWCEELGLRLDSCASPASGQEFASPFFLSQMLGFELRILKLSGLEPDFSGYDQDAEWSAFSLETGSFVAGGGRCIRISRDVADCLAQLQCGAETAPQNIPLDAARVISVFYQFHLDCASDVRRSVLGMIS